MLRLRRWISSRSCLYLECWRLVTDIFGHGVGILVPSALVFVVLYRAWLG